MAQPLYDEFDEVEHLEAKNLYFNAYHFLLYDTVAIRKSTFYNTLRSVASEEDWVFMRLRYMDIELPKGVESVAVGWHASKKARAIVYFYAGSVRIVVLFVEDGAGPLANTLLSVRVRLLNEEVHSTIPAAPAIEIYDHKHNETRTYHVCRGSFADQNDLYITKELEDALLRYAGSKKYTHSALGPAEPGNNRVTGPPHSSRVEHEYEPSTQAPEPKRKKRNAVDDNNNYPSQKHFVQIKKEPVAAAAADSEDEDIFDAVNRDENPPNFSSSQKAGKQKMKRDDDYDDDDEAGDDDDLLNWLIDHPSQASSLPPAEQRTPSRDLSPELSQEILNLSPPSSPVIGDQMDQPGVVEPTQPWIEPHGSMSV